MVSSGRAARDHIMAEVTRVTQPLPSAARAMRAYLGLHPLTSKTTLLDVGTEAARAAIATPKLPRGMGAALSEIMDKILSRRCRASPLIERALTERVDAYVRSRVEDCLEQCNYRRHSCGVPDGA